MIPYNKKHKSPARLVAANKPTPASGTANPENPLPRRGAPKGRGGLEFKKALTCRRQKGRILRVKQGYNPNSSSMGSIIFVLPAALFVITAIFGALSGLLSPLLLRKVEDPDKTITKIYCKLQELVFKKRIKENKQ